MISFFSHSTPLICVLTCSSLERSSVLLGEAPSASCSWAGLSHLRRRQVSCIESFLPRTSRRAWSQARDSIVGRLGWRDRVNDMRLNR